MKLLNKLTLKNLRLNKVRTIVTIVGIMLSAALITVVSGMALSGRQTMIDAQAAWSGNYDVALDIIDNSVIETARNNRNVENAFYKERLGYARTKNADGETCDYSVLANEPTGNLDSKSSEEVMSMLKMCNQSYGQTVIMITHNLDIAKQADRIITISDGKIVEEV